MKSHSLSALLSLICDDAGPFGRPASIGNEIAQGEHRIEVALSPTHASLLEAALDDMFMAAFDCARADGKTMPLKVRVIYHLLPSGEITKSGLKSGFLVAVG